MGETPRTPACWVLGLRSPGRHVQTPCWTYSEALRRGRQKDARAKKQTRGSSSWYVRAVDDLSELLDQQIGYLAVSITQPEAAPSTYRQRLRLLVESPVKPVYLFRTLHILGREGHATPQVLKPLLLHPDPGLRQAVVEALGGKYPPLLKPTPS